jgi:hypothetical protein
METTTKRSSGKEEYDENVRAKFDQLLDALSAKNVRMGRLIEELSHCRDLLERISPDVSSSVRLTIRNRIRNADDILRISTH